MNKLFKKVTNKGIKINHVCEVGVYMPESSNILDFLNNGVKATLVEPDEKSITEINTRFKMLPNVHLFPIAIYDYEGTLTLLKRGASTFVSELSDSPAIINDKYHPEEADRFTVKCTTMDKIDDGTIDLLSIDTEGAEWYVLKNLKSRPSVISVETHGRAYINPFIDEISTWMRINRYVAWYKTNSDTVFSKSDLWPPSKFEKMQLFFKNLHLGYRKFKYS
jgi:FkbM family methyltransferase